MMYFFLLLCITTFIQLMVNSKMKIMMKTKGLVLLTFLLGLLMNVQAADNVNGNGKLSTKSMKIDDFNEVKIDGLMDFNYVQSDSPSSLEITLDENLHQYLDVEIHDRVLTLKFNKKVRVNKITKYVVKTSSKWLKKAEVKGNANFMVNNKLSGAELELKAKDNCLVQFKQPIEIGELKLSVDNSANIVVENMKIDQLNCDMGGSGSIRLKSGSTNKGSFNVLSSGDIHAYGITVSDAKCKMAGSGLIEVHPTGNLKASIVGKGTIRYKGSPVVEQRTIGKGVIENVK